MNELKNYYELPQFVGVYLEDSFVRSISIKPDGVDFGLEFVLNKKHPCYVEPTQGEQYCYKNGSLIFSGFESFEWLDRSDKQFTDANGEIDFGNIDFLTSTENEYEIGGDWGHIKIKGGKLDLHIEP